MIELTPADLPEAIASMSTGAHETRWRKKPVVIEAFQLTMDVVKAAVLDKAALPFGVKISSASYHPENRTVSAFGCNIPTTEGHMRAIENDWIIRGIKGELYPCKPDVFAATYEPESASTGAGITDAERALRHGRNCAASTIGRALLYGLAYGAATKSDPSKRESFDIYVAGIARHTGEK
jgi:hypothetical protein